MRKEDPTSLESMARWREQQRTLAQKRHGDAEAAVDEAARLRASRQKALFAFDESVQHTRDDIRGRWEKGAITAAELQRLQRWEQGALEQRAALEADLRRAEELESTARTAWLSARKALEEAHAAETVVGNELARRMDNQRKRVEAAADEELGEAWTTHRNGRRGR